MRSSWTNCTADNKHLYPKLFLLQVRVYHPHTHQHSHTHSHTVNTQWQRWPQNSFEFNHNLPAKTTTTNSNSLSFSPPLYLSLCLALSQFIAKPHCHKRWNLRLVGTRPEQGCPHAHIIFDYTCFLNTRAIKEPQWNMCVPCLCPNKIHKQGGKGEVCGISALPANCS